jgi:hypothetical protein
VAARRALDVLVRKRRVRLRWVAAAGMLACFPVGALAVLDNSQLWIGVSIWAAGAAAAGCVTAAVYAVERRARFRLHAAVARLSPDDARDLMGELGSAPDEDRRALLSVLAIALDRHPAELLPAPPPPGSAGELSPAGAGELDG